MCLLALHKMHRSCAGFAYTVFINYVVYFLIEEPLRKSLMKTSAQVDETSVTSNDNSPSQDHTHPDVQDTLLS